MKNLKIFTNNIEDKARKQIDLLLDQEPFKDCKVRIMPDVHAGTGCVIGFTADLGNKVIPNIVRCRYWLRNAVCRIRKYRVEFRKIR